MVWEINEKLWQGSLSEGGIVYHNAPDVIVVELARCGIVSSICSKNEVAVIAKRAASCHFVFPRIDRVAKEPKLAALIEMIRLGTRSVLSIDDDPMMRPDALHFMLGLIMASETLVPALLDHLMLRSRPNSVLTHLVRYRLLERRGGERGSAPGDTDDFLRGCGITSSVGCANDASLERASGLINRTNQQNFTKRRLPEELRSQLLRLVHQYDVQGDLMYVRDRYAGTASSASMCSAGRSVRARASSVSPSRAGRWT